MSAPANSADGLARILIVDDDPEMAELLAEILTDEGYHARTATSGREALWMMNSVAFSLVITDLRMHGMSGMKLLAEIRTHHPHTATIMITAFGTINTAIEAMREGAYDYITKPFKTDVILAVVHRAMEKVGLQTQVRTLTDTGTGSFHDMIGTDPAMQRLFDYIQRIAKSPASVLITGESGTGKELVARAIHNESRRDGPVVPVNCAAIPENLLEGEFFGVKKGAYTDAREDRKGLIEAAQGGTLFLDEVGEIPAPLQGKLLRVLQDHLVRRVGDTRETKIDVRFIAATNADLKQRVADGLFREDLYWRLNVIPIHLPPLRDRQADIPLLAQSLAVHFGQENDKQLAGVDAAAMERLVRHPWPGNIRELANSMERAAILTRGPYITTDDLPEDTGAPAAVPGDRRQGGDTLPGGVTLEEMERTYILRVLAESDDNRTLTAKRLGIDRKTLYRKLKAYGMDG